MNGDIKLTAPGGRPGDIWLGTEALSTFTITGRVVSTDGTPRTDVEVTVFERRSLTVDARLGVGRTDPKGTYAVTFALPTSTLEDAFVRAEDLGTSETADSRLLIDLRAGTHVVDLVLGEGGYLGRSEWDRVSGLVDPLLGSGDVKDIPSSRLEWLAKRTDLYPVHLAAYIQAHRLADDRTVKPETCYAFLRAGLPVDMPRLLKAGEGAWGSALRNAWLRKVLSKPGTGTQAELDVEVATEIAAMRELVVEAALAETGVNQRAFLDALSLTGSEQTEFIETWLTHTGSIEEFWQDLRASGTLGEAKTDDIQFAIQGALLVDHCVSALEGLAAERGATNITTISDTTEWDYAAWDAVLVARSVVAPDHVPGADATERRQNFARALERAAEDAFPTHSLRHRIDQDGTPPPHTAELVGFFDANPGFDIVESNIDRWVSDNPTAFSGASDPEAARENLDVMQRIYRLTPRIGRYATARTLLAEGIRSAKDVCEYTRDEFVSKFGALFDGVHHTPDALAGRVWDRSSRIHGSAQAVASYYGLASTGVEFQPLYAMGDWQFEGAGNGLSGLATILGNLDYCACEHCRSVFSPAAYLADLLQFLSARPAEEGNGLSALVARRPDIPHILLDCDNTNTVMPYIDLVNECLEQTFVGGLDGSSNQTTWPADELRLHPEHMNASVYEGEAEVDAQLTEMVHPWVLPLVLPELEAREMLNYLGVPRHRLMTLLRDDDADPDPVPTDASVLADRLGLNSVEFEIIAGTYDLNTSADDREFYGFVDDPGTDGWVNLLNGFGEDGDVGELMRRGDFTLDELRHQLARTFVDPEHYHLTNGIKFNWAETCELAGATISNLDAPALHRLHRFTRLQRRTRVAPRDLNVLVEEVGGGVLDEEFLAKLSNILVLADRFRVKFDEIATWWGTRIDARVYEERPTSLYHRRFLPPGGEVPVGFLPSTDRGDALDGEEAPPVPIAVDELPTVLAAARLRAADYDVLRDGGIVSDLFSFANFTKIYAASSMARALKLSVKELVQLVDMSGMNPFASPADTVLFVEALDVVRSSRLELDELDWVLREVGEPPQDDETIGRELAALSRGLSTIDFEVALLVDPTGEATRVNLESVVSDIEVAMAIVDGSSGLSEAAQEEFIEVEFIGFLDPALAVGALVTGGGSLGEDVVGRYNYVNRAFTSQRRKRALLIDTASSAFDLGASVAEVLLFSLLTQPGTSDPLADSFAASFATEAEIAADGGLTPATHPPQFAAWRRLGKAALVALRHRITALQLPFYSNGAGGDWLDLDSLPLEDADPDATFDSWLRLARALALRGLFQAAEVGHSEVASAATFAGAVERLAELTEWPLDGLSFFADAVGWTSTSIFADEIALERLRDIFVASGQAGVGVDVLWTWIHESLTLAKTGEIKAAARSHAGEDRWPDIAKPLRDRLRAQQRDALIAGVLNENPGMTRADLLNALLIDVEMSPCMLTTRIVQANSSVQMFVHRILLQLEEAIVFAPGAAAAWDWMKNYRVWEANRKVFLYPENWIEPELRKDRTPEFDQLEATLMQDTLDEPKIENALGGYLTALDRIANLEVVAVYRANPFAPLWLLARTQSAPRKWYLRKRNGHTNWEPWEELPLEIESDNVLLFERRGRVLLFWLTLVDTNITKKRPKYKMETVVEHFETKNDPPVKIPIPTQKEIPDGEEDYQVKANELAITWAERDYQGWSSTVMSPRSGPIELINQYSRDRFLLRGWMRDDGVYITTYRQRGNDGEQVHPAASFRYDVTSRHVMCAGQHYTHEDFPDFLNSAHNLVDRALIGLQPEYRLEGQRFVKRQLNDGEMPDLPHNAIESDGEFDPSTEFVQAEFSNVLFHRAPSTGYRTLLHQGDFWSPESDKRFSPVVYDDRQRKYLLEPRDGVVGPQAGDELLSPMTIGGKPYHYYGCIEAVEAPRIRARARNAQPRRDRLASPDPSPNADIQPGDVFALGFSPNLDAYNQGNHMMAGNADTIAQNPALTPSGEVQVKLTCLYHPFARDMLEAVAQDGLDALYRPDHDDDLFRQGLVRYPLSEAGLDLDESILAGTAPVERYEFDFSSPYGLYNWEVFYHIPMFIAGKLTDDQRFAAAQRWFHTMFDPIETVDLPGETLASKFWKIRPFVEQAKNLAKDQFEVMLGIGVTAKEQSEAIAAFEKEVSEWRKNPFDPHAIARVRPGVYQRALLKAYFDNLLGWADHLFRQDTLESINEATILYILVAQLLGPRPQEVPGVADSATAKSFDDLQVEGLDAFSNAAQMLENWILVPTDEAEPLGCGTAVDAPWVRQKVELRFWYFCYPPNPELLAYWDTLDDRLFKIRHCQNIEGVERMLAIFQPPIDPGLLVRAAAAGIDISSVLGELDSGLPPYRFRSVYARAEGFCADVRSLGSALLQAIEKRDSEALALLRSEHEIAMIAAVREIRKRQLDEAKTNLSSLRAAKAMTEDRLAHYEALVEADINGEEKTALKLSLASSALRAMTQSVVALGGILHLIPSFTISIGTDMSQKTEFGGQQLGDAISAAGNALGVVPTTLDGIAAWITTKAGYARRRQDWEFQAKQADAELVRMERDLIGAEIRVAIAERELANHELSATHTRAVDRFMRDKFSNKELYNWMVGQISTLYFQSYQIAFDLAKRAERAYRHELAVDSENSTPIIKYGYWDSLRKGLLAGEKLGHDLKRLDLAYMDRDEREFELRKSVSLAEFNPSRLHELRETGACDWDVPEVLFDLDHPGHLLRRIRAIRLSIPAVVGPNTTLGATLHLLDHKARIEAGGDYPENLEGDDRFRYGSGAGQMIATSTAMNDSGLFNLDFKDERYLPFEYAGAISHWRLELPAAFRQFDYRTIDDVVLHIDYTSRYGGSTQRTAAEGSIPAQFNSIFGEGEPLALLISVPAAFPNEWEQFFTVDDDDHVLSLPITLDHFPHFARTAGLEVTEVSLMMLLDTEAGASLITPDQEATLVLDDIESPEDSAFSHDGAGVGFMTAVVAADDIQPATWTLTIAKADVHPSLANEDDELDADRVVGMLVLIRYTVGG